MSAMITTQNILETKQNRSKYTKCCSYIDHYQKERSSTTSFLLTHGTSLSANNLQQTLTHTVLQYTIDSDCQDNSI